MNPRELKSIIGQNCYGYKPKFITTMMSMGISAESCDNCSNFRDNKCNEDLFNGIKEIVESN